MGSPFLPDVKHVNINHKGSLQEATSRHFHSLFKKKRMLNFLLSLASFGVYPYKLYKKARRAITQAIAARKLFFFNALRDHIEAVRKEHHQSDPRQSLNAIFMKVQSEKVAEEEEALEFKAIYSPMEILLFITNPVRERKKVRLYRLKSHHFDYFKMWHELKKKARVNQYRQIQNINFCNKTLKQEFCLTPGGIQDRLTRSSAYRKSPCLLTQFKELSKAFQEIVIAYQDFEELSESNPKLFHLLDVLAKTSKKDIETLQTYLASRYLPRDLPLENRRQLIQLGNQQDVLYNMSKDEQFDLCALILNQYQWDFLLSIQEVSQVTLNLLDWAFEASPEEIKPTASFIEHIAEEAQKKVKGDLENFPNLNEKIEADGTLCEMTVPFARELHREWPSLHLYLGENLSAKIPCVESLSIEHLIHVYHELQKITEGDSFLFSLLQGAISQEGKNGFQSAIEAGVIKLLGEKSEYFLPILTNSDVTIVKKAPEQVEIRYRFEQMIMKKGEVQHPFQKEKYMIISQPLIKEGEEWISPEPKVKIAVKQGVA